MFVLCRTFHRKYFTVLSRAPEARAKKIWSLDTRAWLKSCKIAAKSCACQDCVDRSGSRMVVVCRASHQKHVTAMLRAAKARAKKIWKLGNRFRSKSFKLAVKSRAFQDYTNRTDSGMAGFLPHPLPPNIKHDIFRERRRRE